MKPGGVHRYVPQIATIKHTSLCDLLNTHQATRHTTQRTFHRTHVATQQLRWRLTSFLVVKVWRDEFLDLDDGWPSKLNSNKPDSWNMLDLTCRLPLDRHTDKTSWSRQWAAARKFLTNKITWRQGKASLLGDQRHTGWDILGAYILTRSPSFSV